mmetsp:Transcript_24061/g.69373  ORF Transcript_24061/g.69373 Transcript_24061/m.69373 type:complete len:240 (+) Transcript_24061:1321-2040(+)
MRECNHPSSFEQTDVFDLEVRVENGPVCAVYVHQTGLRLVPRQVLLPDDGHRHGDLCVVAGYIVHLRHVLLDIEFLLVESLGASPVGRPLGQIDVTHNSRLQGRSKGESDDGCVKSRIHAGLHDAHTTLQRQPREVPPFILLPPPPDDFGGVVGVGEVLELPLVVGHVIRLLGPVVVVIAQVLVVIVEVHHTHGGVRRLPPAVEHQRPVVHVNVLDLHVVLRGVEEELVVADGRGLPLA